jgi:phosphatidylserine/phosphatidylglycerophosphate/cardiolipin synthase-like enzyme
VTLPPAPNFESTEATPDWIQVYFTDPTAPQAADYTGGPDEALAAAIDAARLSVDVAAYSLNLWSVRDALLRAWERGVVVRLVMESDNMEVSEVRDLQDAGIPIVGDRRQGLMHDKFVVIDRAEVWVGSMNYTVGGAYHDDNNLVRIRSVEVAEDYTVEFEEMFLDDRFGDESPANTPNPRLTIDGTRVEVYFSPDDGVAEHIIALIEGAQRNVYFMAFSFTSDDIGQAIRERAVFYPVMGVMDAEQVETNEGTEYGLFRDNALDVRLDGNDGLMHHKVIIIDQEIVLFGSYNFTASAETRNDENLVVIYNPEVAARFVAEFRRVYDQAQP